MFYNNVFHSLPQQLFWGLLLNFNWFVQYIKIPNVSTTICTEKVILCFPFLITVPVPVDIGFQYHLTKLIQQKHQNLSKLF